MTSETEVKTAKNVGINNTVSGGFPKLDSLTDGSIKGTDIKALRTKIGMNNGKKTLLFSSTWKGSGMSALDKWIDRLEELKNEYNILVTIHPLSDKNDRKKLQNTENIYFIEENFIYPYMIMSDALISDTSSIIAEYCVLYKPVIVFDTPDAGRTDPEVSELINKLSYKINGFDDLLNLLPEVWNEPHSRINEQKNAVKIFFDDDSPGKGKRSSDIINTFLKENLYQ